MALVQAALNRQGAHGLVRRPSAAHRTVVGMDGNGQHGMLYAITIGAAVVVLGGFLKWLAGKLVVSRLEAHIALEVEQRKANEKLLEDLRADLAKAVCVARKAQEAASAASGRLDIVQEQLRLVMQTREVPPEGRGRR